MIKTPSLDPTEKDYDLLGSPFYLIAHADFRYHEDLETALVKRGVSKNIYRVLTILRGREFMSISDLAENALIKRNTVSRLIERMTQLTLVTTAVYAEDNRVTVVSLTAVGQQLLDELTPIAARQIKRAMDGLSKKEIGDFVGTLQHIIDNLNKLAIE